MLYQGGWSRSGPLGGDWIPGNSRLCSSVQIPQNVAMTRSIPTAARGVDINGLRHLYQGSVGDGKHWITGIQGSHGVINLHFVYTLSLLLQLFIQSRASLFILGGNLNHTNAHGVVSVLMAGIPL